MPNLNNLMIYKLKYTSEKEAISDLIEKGVIDEEKNFMPETIAVVWLGLVVLENGEYNDKGEEIKAPIFAEGYHVDLMLSREIEFTNQIFPKNPKHTFL